MSKRIVIIGAGPTGLGAAYRLQELGYKSWHIYEKESFVGGLASSFRDAEGFTWDTGGHVIFSHYRYFDKLFEKFLKKKYLEHNRESWIWVFNRFVPYPFQNNIKYLPKDKLLKCIDGLIDVQKDRSKPKNFKEWILSIFGKGIAGCFMFPYNLKVWQTPLEDMSKNWIAERVSVIDLKRILRNVILDEEDVDWGPNSKFKFPLYGGTGGFFGQFERYIKNNLSLEKEVIQIDIESKKLGLKNKEKVNYDLLINTMPIDQLINSLKNKRENLEKAAQELKYSSVLVVGVGLKKRIGTSKCWVYFPENKFPFYRITFFSNYSPHNTPKGKYASLICEVPYSDWRKVNKKRVVEDVIKGLIGAKIIDKRDKELIVSRYLIQRDYAYPVPTLHRDKALKEIQLFLEKNNIYSRGRFGAWKYEIGNMDHSVMMGKEIVDRILKGAKEKVWSL